MLLTLHTTLHILSFSYVVYLLQDLLTLTIDGSGYLFDFTARLNINETYVNSFNFFWTSFTYLPTFFFGIYFLCYMTDSRQLLWTLLLGFTLYNFELVDMITSTLSLSLNDLSRTSVNLLLLNSLNKYHPFIFYVSVYITLSLVLKSIRILSSNEIHPFNLNQTLSYFRDRCRWTILSNFAALFMGSWWALQEGTWGGWWNWDPSEVFGLMFGLAALWLQHISGTNTTFVKVVNKFLQLAVITFLTYFFIQLNFDLVSHNFGAKFFFFFNNNLFFLEAIMLLSASYILMILRTATRDLELHHSFISRVTYLPSNLSLLLLTPLLNGIIFVLILLSFTPLLNYFLWNFLGVNTFNGFKEYTNWIVYFLLLMIAPFYKHPLGRVLFSLEYVLLVLITSVSGTSATSYLLFLSLTRSRVRILHALVVYFLLSNTLSSFSDFILWALDEDDQSLVLSNSTLNPQTYSYSCSNEFAYSHLIRTNSCNNPLFTSGVYYTSNSLTLQPFLLIFNSNLFTNVYNLSLNWVNSNIYIESTFLNNTYDCILPVLLLSWYLLAL